MSEGKPLPQYKCHKVVGALKILSISADGIVQWEDETYPTTQLELSYIERHKPEVGGYYVVYDDDYASYSPAKAFEEGYTLIEPKKETVWVTGQTQSSEPEKPEGV